MKKPKPPRRCPNPKCKNTIVITDGKDCVWCNTPLVALPPPTNDVLGPIERKNDGDTEKKHRN